MSRINPNQITEENAVEILQTAFPKKAAAPLLALHEKGILPGSALKGALKAALLSGEEARLQGVTMSILARGINMSMVLDTIDMAAKYGRRVNALWSQNRWREEHDALSRYETLAKLREASETYDLKEFEKHLPQNWPGYLIRTSRRLGMEGLRQRHCVASWHTRVRTGGVAIAVVFVEKTRWTVELFCRGDALSLGQIKSRFNKNPPSGTVTKIRESLGIEDKTPEKVETNGVTHADRTTTVSREFERVIGVMRENNTGDVRVEFSGYGDSGSIEYISADTDVSLEQIPTQVFQPGGYTFDVTYGRIAQPHGYRDGTLYDAIEAIVYEYLETTGIDWYNNDGGFGDVTLHVDEGTVEVDISTRYTETNTELMATFEAGTWDQIG